MPNVSQLTQDPMLFALAPMVYVAWADGELSDKEIANISALVHDQTALSPQAKSALSQWLDPAAAPSASDLARLLDQIQTKASTLPRSERDSLVRLGLELAQVEGTQGIEQALQSLQGALGIGAREAAARFRHKDRPRPEPESWRTLEPPAPFDIAKLTALLDGPYAPMRERIREILRKEPSFAYDYELSKEQQREQVFGWLKILADHKIGHEAFPGVTTESQDIGAFIAAFETLATFDLSLVIKFGVQFGLFGGSIYFLGSKTHHDAYLPGAASVEIPGCFAMTELGHGSNVRDLGTTATYHKEKQCWVIETPDEMSRKEWIGNAAAHAQLATVFAQLQVEGVRYGVHAFVVPIRSPQGDILPGVHVDDCGHKLGLNGVDNGRLWFDAVEIPRENLLDRYASVSPEGQYSSPIESEGKRFFTMLGTLVGGRVSVGASALSAAKSAVTIATRYGAMRRQFGPEGQPERPILDFQTHKRRLMPLLANAYALSFAAEHVTKKFVSRDSNTEREVESLAAGFKAWSTWNTTKTVQIARECCGGQGYLSVNRFASLKADTDIFTTFEGDNTVLMQLVAKSLLGEYAQQFQDLNFLGTLRFLADQARAQLTELDPVTSRRTDSEHLRDTTWLLEMFRHREKMLLGSVARRFKRRVDDGMNSFDAMNQVQSHLVDTANAHVERVILEAFIDGVQRAGDPALTESLRRLCALFGLEQMHQDLAWFMENSLVEAPKARAIRAELIVLCDEVRQEAVHLTEAFGIPESVLAAPIAHSPVVEPGGSTGTAGVSSGQALA